MRAYRGQRGQTAAEYLGVLFFTLALILLFASTDFPGRLAHGVGHQICVTINHERDCGARTAVPTPPATRSLLSAAPKPRGGAVRVTHPGEQRFLPKGAGWVQTWGTDGLGRSAGVDFVVAKDALKVPRAGRAATPKGFARVQAWAQRHGFQVNRTPLFPGEPDAPANVIIAPERFKSALRPWENRFTKLLRQGETVHVSETPSYRGRELVPRSVRVDVSRVTARGDQHVAGAGLDVWPGEPPPGIPAG